VRYHDEEWGRPLHGDAALFEMLTLEGAQAGLSWETVLRRRANYRRAFAGFDVDRVAAFTDTDVERFMADAGLIRNRAKITATVDNARAVQRLRADGGSFDAYIWSYTGGAPRHNGFRSDDERPAWTVESRDMSEDLQRHGFRFVGPTICYAFMQAAGLVNDHLRSCFRYSALGGS
jgi:DNA-3-methyladenine glycosylase I